MEEKKVEIEIKLARKDMFYLIFNSCIGIGMVLLTLKATKEISVMDFGSSALNGIAIIAILTLMIVLNGKMVSSIDATCFLDEKETKAIVKETIRQMEKKNAK